MPGRGETAGQAVDASYFLGGTEWCVEVARRSATAGIIKARLTWQDGARMNFRQSIAANRCCESFEFFVNAGTDYILIPYRRGVDAQFLRTEGPTGRFATPFTLDIERPGDFRGSQSPT